MGPNDLNQGGQEADKLGGSEKQRDNADPLFTVVDAADAVPVKKIHEVFEGQDEDDVHLWKQAGLMASNIALLFCADGGSFMVALICVAGFILQVRDHRTRRQ